MIGISTLQQKSIIVGGPLKYYTAYASTNLYIEKTFGGDCHSLTIQNTHASDPVQFSFDGVMLHGDLSAGESITVNLGNETSIYLKSTAGTATIRVWGW